MDLKFIPTGDNFVNYSYASENLQEGSEGTEQNCFADRLKNIHKRVGKKIRNIRTNKC